MSYSVDGFVSKYMGILGVEARPIIQIKGNLGSRWLGRCKWAESMPHTSIIQLQRSVLGHERTLERVVAHEMIHHRDYLAMTPSDVALLRLRIKRDGHGRSFHQGMDLINRIMGPNFVTVASDQEDVVASLGREYFMLIAPVPPNRIGYAWAARLSPEAHAVIQERIAEGARLLRTTEEKWTHGRAKIKRYGGLTLPKAGTPEDTELRAMYDRAPRR